MKPPSKPECRPRPAGRVGIEQTAPPSTRWGATRPERSIWLKPILQLLLVLLALFLPHTAEASHFRYANLSFAPTGTAGQVRFNLQVAVRGDWFGSMPAVGSITTSLGSFEFGDGATTPLRLKVVATSPTENWFVGDLVGPDNQVGVSRTYSGTGPYLAGVNICCRISYQNGGASTFLARSIVLPFSGNSSPVSSMVPVLYVPKSTASTFMVPATDPDGDTLRFRMASATDSAAPAPANMTINPTTGQVTWNNAALPTSLPYMAQFIVEDRDLNGNLKSSIPVECVVWISSNAGTAPEVEIHTLMPGQPEHGPITVTHGTPVSFTVEAHDSDPGASVTLNTGGIPQGAAMTPSLPISGGPGVTSSFSWTPAKSQVGTHVITYSAVDNTGFQSLASMTVNVIQTDIIAANDTYSIGKNGTLTISAPGVLGNDVSEDGSPLTAILASNPAQGTLAFNADGSFTYSPGGHVGTASFNYRATDGTVQSNPASVQIQCLNAAPLAHAGTDTNAVETQTVTLDGSLSSDPDGDTLSYSWQQVSGTPASLSNPLSPTPSFTAPLVPGSGDTLTFQLTVGDGSLSSTALVNVTIAKMQQAPVAIAKVVNASVPAGALVVLDGSDSYDPDNDPLTYLWTQTAGPTVTIHDATSPTASFTAPFVGPAGQTFVFSLVVKDDCVDTLGNDCSLSSDPSAVTVQVTFYNRPPTAVTGADQTVDEGSPVVLDGGGSSDPDDNALLFEWTAPAEIQLDLSDPAAPSFVAPQVACGGASFIITLKVDDGFGGVDTSSVQVHVNNLNNPPLAAAGGNQQVAEGTNVSLAGSGSDVDGEALGYSWKQLAGPTVGLTGESTPTLQFTAPVLPGGAPSDQQEFEFELTVTDICGASHSDTVTVLVVNVPSAPVANAGGSQMANEAANVVLDGSASSDPDDDPITFAWTQVAGPAVVLQDPSGPHPSFAAPFVSSTGATLVFQLEVSDPYGGSDTDEVTVNILNINDPPNCSQATASLASIWPANHKFVPVGITGVLDPDSNHTIEILSVTQDEAVNVVGSGNTGPDAIIQGETVLLRAERSGTANGRVYHVTFVTRDYEGSCTGTVRVTVPHSRAKPATDDGPLFDSAKP